MPLDITQFFGGPCLIHYRGASLYAKDGVNVDLSPTLFYTGSDLYQDQNPRVSQRNLKVSFTPTGRWSDYTKLLPYPGLLPGQPLNGVIPLVWPGGSGDTPITVDSRLATGDAIRIGGRNALPGELSRTTTYYVSIPADNASVFYLYTDRALSISEAAASINSNAIMFTSPTSGTPFYVVRQEPLEIFAMDGSGVKLTLWNAVLPAMPELTLVPTATIFGQVAFEAMPVNGSGWSDANSLYTLGTHSLTDAAYDGTDPVTVPYSVAWGSTAPWSALEPASDIKVAWNMKTQPMDTGTHGLVGYRFMSMLPKVTLTAKNVSEGDIEAVLRFQDTGAARGQRLANDQDLTITGPGSTPGLMLFAARLITAPFMYKAGADRAGALVFEATRQFSGGTGGAWFALE